MPLDPLATTADLTARGIDASNTTRAERFLESASSEVRNAAGVPITAGTFTTVLPGTSEQWLTLPGQPVTDVSQVLIDGEQVDDWKLIAGRLWRRGGWQLGSEPVEVTVTLTGGLSEVPEDIVDLVCSLTGLALGQSEDGGYASRGDRIASRIDDYSEQYDSSIGGRKAGPIELPDATRNRLRARFGGGASLVVSR